MRDEPEIRDWELHIRAAARPEHETLLLADRLLRECWPGGQADRSEPVARGWLRLWGPVKVIAVVPACECHRGRCRICN
ncbi:hypothetical protein [Conexibacter sp. DBS9H8]|uniref:hypothetical protein n=1 Tax=Conexibacter sp. DBS9H8 TaxID=2937801 RepID=UPI00200E3D08|nr:hypothetical protein [Conexibacter sp. DBS9H8]